VPTILSSIDIEDMIDKERDHLGLSENFPIFSTLGKRKKPLISKGLKIKHGNTGLTYTCQKLMKDKEDGSLIIIAINDGDGSPLSIHHSEFSDYERV